MNDLPEGLLDVIIVEDEADARASLASAIRADPRMQLVAAATNFSEGVESLNLSYDVVVIDIRLPGGSDEVRIAS